MINDSPELKPHVSGPLRQRVFIRLQENYYYIKRNVFLILSFSLVSTGLCVIAIYSMNSIYRGQVTLSIEAVDGNSIHYNNLAISDAKRTAHYSTQLEILKSKGLAEQVVDSLGLINHEAFKPKIYWGRRLSFDRSASGKQLAGEKKKARAVEQLRNNLVIKPIHNTSLVKVGYESPDANLAALIANELAKTYVVTTSEDLHHIAQQMVGWLSKNIEVLKTNLAESEKELREYRETAQMTELERVKTVFAGELDELTANLAKTKHARTQIEKALEQVNDLSGKRIDALSSMPEVFEPGIVQQLKDEQVMAEMKVVEMSKRYKNNHPTMVAVVSELALVKDSTKTKIEGIVEEINKEYRFISGKEDELIEDIHLIRHKVKEIREKERKLEQLSRREEIDKKVYDTLIEIVEDVSKLSGLKTTSARIIDAADIPIEPVRPQRLLLSFTAFIVSLIGGIFLADYRESKVYL